MKIKISFFCAIMIAALFLSHSYLSISALLAATLHELGHIACAKKLGIPLSELKLGIFGASLMPRGSLCSYKDEILLCAAGPLVNIICGIALFPFRNSLGDLATFFMCSSLFLGTLNLLPVTDFDGGRILSCIISQTISPQAAATVCRRISFSLVIALWMISVYLLLRLHASLSLFVFSSSLFCKIFIREKN